MIRTRSAIPLALVAAFCLSACGQSSSMLDLWRGTKDYASGDYGRSLERFQTAEAARPGDPRPEFNSGDSRYKLGQYDEANKDFSTVGENAKNAAAIRRDAFFNLGNSHYQKGEYKDAAEAYKRCLMIDPKDEDCRFNLVKALAAQKKPPEKNKDKKEQQKKQDQKKDEKKDDQNKDKNNPKRPDKPRTQSQELSQEDAERILQAVKEKEKGTPVPQPSWAKPNQKQGDQPVDW